MNETKIENLWTWFVSNEQRIIDCVEHETAADYIVENLNNLILDMGKFSWEIGEGKMKPWYLTISPNEDLDQMRVSKKIIAGAPDLDNWEFNYSKPAKDWDRRFNIYDHNMEVQQVDASGWKYVTVPHGEGMVKLILETGNIAHLDHDTAITAANQIVTNEIGEEAKLGKIASVSIVDEMESKYDSQKTEIHFLKNHLPNL